MPLLASGKIRFSPLGSLAPSSFAITGVLATNPFYRLVGTASYFKQRVASDKLEASSEIANEYASRLLRSYQVNAKNEKLMNTALVDYEASVASYKEALLAKLSEKDGSVTTQEHLTLCLKHLRLADEVQSWKEIGVAQKGLVANIGDTFSVLAIALLGSDNEVQASLINEYRDVALTKATVAEQLRLAETLTLLAQAATWKNVPSIASTSSAAAGEVFTKFASAPEQEVLKTLTDAVGSKAVRYQSVVFILELAPFAANQELLDLKSSLQEQL